LADAAERRRQSKCSRRRRRRQNVAGALPPPIVMAWHAAADPHVVGEQVSTYSSDIVIICRIAT